MERLTVTGDGGMNKQLVRDHLSLQTNGESYKLYNCIREHKIK